MRLHLLSMPHTETTEDYSWCAFTSPVLCTDWGAFTETVEQGKTGFRAVTIPDFVRAANRVKDLDRNYIRQRAIEKYSLSAIGPQYTDFFERLQEIMPTGLGKA